MIRTTTAAVAMLGAGALAAAQTATLLYDFGAADPDALQPNSTYSITVSIAFVGGQDNVLAVDYTAMLESTVVAAGGLESRIERVVGIDSDFQAQGGSVTTDGTTIEVNFLGPTNLFVPAEGSPQELYTIELVTGSEGEIRISHSESLISTFNSQFDVSVHTLENDEEAWLVVPAPGAAVIAGLAGLVVARRRRG